MFGGGSFATLGGIGSQQTPLFRQSLKNEAAALSIKHKDFYFSDHSCYSLPTFIENDQ